MTGRRSGWGPTGGGCTGVLQASWGTEGPLAGGGPCGGGAGGANGGTGGGARARAAAAGQRYGQPHESYAGGGHGNERE